MVVNDAADFSGSNGCYLYKGRDAEKQPFSSLKDQILVVAPHTGIVSSEVWLACRKKLMNNLAFGSEHKGKNTWLVGKIKCANCSGGLMAGSNKYGVAHLRCRRRLDNKSCEGCGRLTVSDAEDFVYKALCCKMADFKTLTKGNPTKANPKLTALKVSLAQVEAEIDDLLGTLKGANATLLSYANKMIEELDSRKQLLDKQIADMSTATISSNQVERISGYLDNWEDISFDDKRLVVGGLISVIKTASGKIDIEWKI